MHCSGRLMVLRTEARASQPEFQAIAVVPGRLPLAQAEDVGQAEKDRDDRDAEGGHQPRPARDQEQEEQDESGPDAAHQPPEEISL